MNIYETPEMEVLYFDIGEVNCLFNSQNAQFSEEESGSADKWL